MYPDITSNISDVKKTEKDVIKPYRFTRSFVLFKMSDYHIPLFPGERYHILSRAIGDEKLFRQESNYWFFMSRYHKYISRIAETYCYSLLPNHFHFLIRIKEQIEIRAYYEQLKRKSFSTEYASAFIIQQFSNLLNGYAKAYNEMFNRKGSLFIDYLRRVEIIKDSQFGATVFYIHKNPIHHGYCEKMEQWKWSSFNTLLSDEPTKLLRQQVLDWFGGREGFIQYHNQPVYLKKAAELE